MAEFWLTTVLFIFLQSQCALHNTTQVDKLMLFFSSFFHKQYLHENIYLLWCWQCWHTYDGVSAVRYVQGKCEWMRIFGKDWRMKWSDDCTNVWDSLWEFQFGRRTVVYVLETKADNLQRYAYKLILVLQPRNWVQRTIDNPILFRAGTIERKKPKRKSSTVVKLNATQRAVDPNPDTL